MSNGARVKKRYTNRICDQGLAVEETTEQALYSLGNGDETEASRMYDTGNAVDGEEIYTASRMYDAGNAVDGEELYTLGTAIDMDGDERIRKNTLGVGRI